MINLEVITLELVENKNYHYWRRNRKLNCSMCFRTLQSFITNDFKKAEKFSFVDRFDHSK